VAREYAESDDMFERAETEDVASSANTFPRLSNTFPSPRLKAILQANHHGPLVRRPFTSHGPRIGRGHLIHRPFKGFSGLRFGHGVPSRPFNGLQRPRFGQIGPSLRPKFLRAASRRGIAPREYAESDDMFERDLEDFELDARDFDDELYLD
jgi:hypothetical protein